MAIYIYRYRTIKDKLILFTINISKESGIGHQLRKGAYKNRPTGGGGAIQHLVEGAYNQDEEPEIAKILDIWAVVYETGKEVVQDKVMVEGVLRYNLLYIPVGDNKAIAQAEVETGFVQYVDLVGAKPRMTADISFELEHLDYDIINSRRLSINRCST